MFQHPGSLHIRDRRSSAGPLYWLFPTQLNELDHQDDEHNHNGYDADHQSHYGIHLHNYHLPFRRKLRQRQIGMA